MGFKVLNSLCCLLHYLSPYQGSFFLLTKWIEWNSPDGSVVFQTARLYTITMMIGWSPSERKSSLLTVQYQYQSLIKLSVDLFAVARHVRDFSYFYLVPKGKICRDTSTNTTCVVSLEGLACHRECEARAIVTHIRPTEYSIVLTCPSPRVYAVFESLSAYLCLPMI